MPVSSEFKSYYIFIINKISAKSSVSSCAQRLEFFLTFVEDIIYSNILLKHVPAVYCGRT